MNQQQISEFFAHRRDNNDDMAWITVFETSGSTYSKAGAYMLVDQLGQFCGMLSGGCLEGDLAERAKSALLNKEAQVAEYDLRDEDDLFGLGIGCQGLMRVLIQPILADNDYEPYRSIDRLINNAETVEIVLVTKSASESVQIGNAIVASGGNVSFASISQGTQIDITTPRLIDTKIDGVACQLFVYSLGPSPSLLVLGAGLDSEPLVQIAHEMGWRCTVQDHRPDYIENRNFPAAVNRVCVPARQLDKTITLSDFDLAVIMSHHLVSDEEYLRQVAGTSIGYIGLLGPAQRRDRILRNMGDLARSVKSRLHGPAGLNLGGRGPGPIALSIVAEMQQFLAEHQ